MFLKGRVVRIFPVNSIFGRRVIACCLVSAAIVAGGCSSDRSAGDLGDVSAESAVTLVPQDSASLFQAKNLTSALMNGSKIIAGSRVESVQILPGKMFVTAETPKGQFASIVVAANQKVHAVVSDSPRSKAVDWSSIDPGAPGALIDAVVAKGATLSSVRHVDAAVSDSGVVTWTVHVDGPIGRLEGDAHGKPAP